MLAQVFRSFAVSTPAGFNQPQYQIDALADEGRAAGLRHQFTDFGSGWQGLFSKNRPPFFGSLKTPPRYAFRVRDVGELGIDPTGHAQASRSMREVEWLANSRSSQAEEVIRVDLNRLKPREFQVLSRGESPAWIKFNRPIREQEIQVVRRINELDRRAADLADDPLRQQALAAGHDLKSLSRQTGLSPVRVRTGLLQIRESGFQELKFEAWGIKRAVLNAQESAKLSQAVMRSGSGFGISLANRSKRLLGRVARLMSKSL